jgi:hypothetical protein
MKITTKTIHVRVRNMAEVDDFVTKEIPRLYRGVFVSAVARELAAILSISEPAYNYQSRARAYGFHPEGKWTYERKGKTFTMSPVEGYFSAAQFHYVMAGISSGRITPGTSQRTGATQDGWQAIPATGAKAAIVNKTEGARWTQNDYWQARQPALVGWKKAGETITENLDDAMVRAIDNVMDAMAGKGQ